MKGSDNNKKIYSFVSKTDVDRKLVVCRVCIFLDEIPFLAATCSVSTSILRKNQEGNLIMFKLTEADTRGVLKNLANLNLVTPLLESLFNKKRLQHRCFNVRCVKFLRTLLLKNISERPLLFKITAIVFLLGFQ